MADPDSCAQPAQGPHRLRGTALWALGRAAVRSQHHTHERLASAGIRKWHYAVLATVADQGPITQAEIGRRVGIDRSDMVALLNDLESWGYVERATDPADRRRNHVTVTTTGERVLGYYDTLFAEANDRLLEPLSAAERAQLITLLERIAGVAPD